MQVGSSTGSEFSEITLMGEITWREGAGEPTSTRTFLVVVENDVNRGTEASPESLPGPEDFIADRALLYDRAQSLSAADKARALQNLGLPGKHDYAATARPTADDDSTQGWEVGSLWVVTEDPPVIGVSPGQPADPPDETGYSPVEIYRCLDASEGAAVWHMTTLDPSELGHAAFRDTVFAGITFRGGPPSLGGPYRSDPGGVETNCVRDGDLPGGAAGTDPFVHGGGERDSELGREVLALAEQLQVALGHLVAGLEAIGQPNADLLGDDLGLLHAGEVAASPPSGLLPVQGEHRVSVGAVDRVDLHPGRTGSDLDDAVATLAFAGHTTLLSRQLFWNSCWRICPGCPGAPEFH